MGINNWYDGRIRENLAFEGVPTSLVQQHFDLCSMHGYTGLDIRYGKEIVKLLPDRRLRVEYIAYILERVESRLENLTSRIFNGLLDAILPI